MANGEGQQTGDVMVIGAVARKTGVTVTAIRYYEESGLIPAAERAPNGHRIYGRGAMDILRFVKRARDLGFSTNEIAALLALWRNDRRASADVLNVAMRHIDRMDRKISQLEQMRRMLVRLVRRCDRHGRPERPIVDEAA